MAVSAPDWLTQRGGNFKLGSDGRTWYVFVDDQPLYALVAVPAEGKHGCAIRQTRNGQRIACATVASSSDDALKAGLDELRKVLGW